MISVWPALALIAPICSRLFRVKTAETSSTKPNNFYSDTDCDWKRSQDVREEFYTHNPQERLKWKMKRMKKKSACFMFHTHSMSLMRMENDCTEKHIILRFHHSPSPACNHQSPQNHSDHMTERLLLYDLYTHEISTKLGWYWASSHIYVYSTLYNTNCFKAALH